MAEACETKLPDWISAETFENFLREHEPELKKIQKFHAECAVAPGENYATILLRLDIRLELNDGRQTDKFFVLKIPNNSEFMKEWQKSYDIFEIEQQVYKHVIPELEEIYRNAGVNVCFGAKHYDFQAPDGSPCLLLENLTASGFKNTKRQDGLDEEHTKRVLKKLAQLHAVTATRAATRGSYNMPGMFASLMEDKSKIEEFKIIFRNTLESCLPTYKGSELYAELVIKLQNNYANELRIAMQVDPNEFNVLNHGDCWSNNVMFQYGPDGNISECYFVDFQMPSYGSPARDLQYFIISSTKLGIKIRKFDYFIKCYHDHLVEHLLLLKYPKQLPTLKELHISLIKYSFLSYGAATSVMGAVLADPSKNANVDNFLGSNEAGIRFRKQLFGNPRYREHIEQILPWLYYRGALDCDSDQA